MTPPMVSTSLDESRNRPVAVPHALEVDAQPDEAVTGTVAGVPLDTLVAVGGAQGVAWWIAEVPSAASEDVMGGHRVVGVWPRSGRRRFPWASPKRHRSSGQRQEDLP